MARSWHTLGSRITIMCTVILLSSIDPYPPYIPPPSKLVRPIIECWGEEGGQVRGRAGTGKEGKIISFCTRRSEQGGGDEGWGGGWGERDRSTILYTLSLGIYQRHGGGVNFHYKGINMYMNKYMNGYLFHFKSKSMGYLFQSHPKSIRIGNIREKVQFSLWEVYKWVCFLNSPIIWMEWGPGTPAARPYPNPWRVTNPPPRPYGEMRPL